MAQSFFKRIIALDLRINTLEGRTGTDNIPLTGNLSKQVLKKKKKVLNFIKCHLPNIINY